MFSLNFLNDLIFFGLLFGRPWFFFCLKVRYFPKTLQFFFEYWRFLIVNDSSNQNLSLRPRTNAKEEKWDLLTSFWKIPSLNSWYKIINLLTCSCNSSITAFSKFLERRSSFNSWVNFDILSWSYSRSWTRSLVKLSRNSLADFNWVSLSFNLSLIWSNSRWVSSVSNFKSSTSIFFLKKKGELI